MDFKQDAITAAFYMMRNPSVDNAMDMFRKVQTFAIAEDIAVWKAQRIVESELDQLLN